MASPKVSVIILNYNGKNFLRKCLESVAVQTYGNVEIIVPDNNSSDRSYECAPEFPQAKFFLYTENHGYAKGNNLAAQETTGEFLLILNNDTEIFPDMIERLVESYQERSMVCPAQILMVNKGRDASGSAGTGMDIFGFPYVNTDPKKTRCFYADGSAIFLKKKDFIDLGMFDEELFMFQEDIDLSWRAQMRGFNLIQCWDAKYYHFSGGAAVGGGSKNTKYVTSAFRRYHNERNVIRNILKNYSLFFVVLTLPALLCIQFLEMITLCLMGQFRVAACYVRAYYWNITHIRSTWVYRKQNQAKREVSDFILVKRMYFAYSKFTSLYRIGFPEFK